MAELHGLLNGVTDNEFSSNNHNEDNEVHTRKRKMDQFFATKKNGLTFH